MKIATVCITLLLTLMTSLPGRGQSPTVRFVLNRETFRSVRRNFRDSAEKALQIESLILSSQEFKDSLLAHTFTCHNYPASPCNCQSNNTTCTTRINGSVVYDSLMKHSLVTMTLVLRRATIGQRRFSKSYGASCPCIPTTTTYTWWLENDELPLTQNYAAHLAHEYTHIVGFVHGDQSLPDDASYVVGNIVEHILVRQMSAQVRR